jgi:putative tricarboxylic transport membrane protein
MAHEPEAAGGGIRTVVVDIITAALIFIVGAVVVWDSHRLGSSWGAEGPQAGYFPFYIGVLICISSAVVLATAVMNLSDRHVFVRYAQLKQVLVILLPSTAYVLGIQYIGIYVSSTVFICLFMRFVGSYGWVRSALVGLAVSALAFPLFEVWFTIPLPKGPLENLLGY